MWAGGHLPYVQTLQRDSTRLLCPQMQSCSRHFSLGHWRWNPENTKPKLIEEGRASNIVSCSLESGGKDWAGPFSLHLKTVIVKGLNGASK